MRHGENYAMIAETIILCNNTQNSKKTRNPMWRISGLFGVGTIGLEPMTSAM